MAFSRGTVIAAGGFDPRLAGAAEDNDFCYRWTRAGRPLRYDPALVVWHHDWRSPEELKRLYFGYGEGQGALYAKHLRRSDLRVLRFLAEDLRWAARATLGAAVKRDGTDAMPTWMMLRGLPHGLRAGWREFGARDHPS
jgi:GT2 family glycosyltransferase